MLGCNICYEFKSNYSYRPRTTEGGPYNNIESTYKTNYIYNPRITEGGPSKKNARTSPNTNTEVSYNRHSYSWQQSGNTTPPKIPRKILHQSFNIQQNTIQK